MKQSQNIERLETVLGALGPIASKMVFTGGSVIELYTQNEPKPSPRPTKDVDSIVSAATLLEYQKLEMELHMRGFVNAGLVGRKGPTCRYIIQDIIFDVMPDDEKVLGFSNQWFEYALENPFEHRLPSGKIINLVTFPRFLAIKLETLADRGGEDVRGSHDLEDIVRLIAGRKHPVKEIVDEVVAIRNYVKDAVRELLRKSTAREAIEGAAPLGLMQAENVFRTLETLSHGMSRGPEIGR